MNYQQRQGELSLKKHLKVRHKRTLPDAISMQSKETREQTDGDRTVRSHDQWERAV